MRARLGFSWMAALLILGLAPLARGETNALSDAKRKIDGLQYGEASSLLKAARNRSGVSHDDLLQILELQGVTSAALGHTEDAEQFFRELVLLAPTAKLPKRWGPKIQTSFFAAKAWLDEQQPMTLNHQPPQLADGKIVAVQVQLGYDPLQVVRRVRVHLAFDGGATTTETREARAPVVVSIAVNPSATVRWWAESLGVHDEVLQLLASADAPVLDHVDAPPAKAAALTVTPTVAEGAAPAAAVEKSSEGEPTLRPLAYTLLGVGVASLAVGAVFAAKVSSDHSQLDHPQLDANGHVTGLTQAAAQAVVNQSATNATLANIFLVGGGAVAAGGAGVFVYGMLNPSTGSGAGGEIGVSGKW